VVGVVAGVAAARPLLLWAHAGPQLAVSLAACLLSGGLQALPAWPLRCSYAIKKKDEIERVAKANR
jgi:ribosomal protein S7